MSEDALFEMKNAFYVGNFQQCINEASKAKGDDNEKRCFMYRAYIAQRNFSVVISEIHSSDSPSLLAIRLLAKFYMADKDERENLHKEMKQKLASSTIDDYIVLIVAATMEYLDNNPEGVLKILHSSNHIECMSMMVQTYLKMDRIDFARKEVKKMMDKDEDSTLTQLSIAWLNLFLGGEKLVEAYYIFKELCDKYNESPLLLNGLAISQMMQSNYEEAEFTLQNALSKDIYNIETMINLIHYFHRYDKDNDANRFLQQISDLKIMDKTYLDQINSKKNEFERLSLQYSTD